MTLPLILALFGVLVYSLFWRPQKQQLQRQRAMIKAIGAGDAVLMNGGLVGRVVDVAGDRMQLEIADGVVVEFLSLAVSRRLEESELSAFGTMFALDDTAIDDTAIDDGALDEESDDDEEEYEDFDSDDSGADDEEAESAESSDGTELADESEGSEGEAVEEAGPDVALTVNGAPESGEAAGPAPDQEPR